MARGKTTLHKSFTILNEIYSQWVASRLSLSHLSSAIYTAWSLSKATRKPRAYELLHLLLGTFWSVPAREREGANDNDFQLVSPSAIGMGQITENLLRRERRMCMQFESRKMCWEGKIRVAFLQSWHFYFYFIAKRYKIQINMDQTYIWSDFHWNAFIDTSPSLRCLKIWWLLFVKQWTDRAEKINIKCLCIF